jgi:hypothetical protein
MLGLSINSPVIVKVAVIANAVKPSMTPDCMDCRATLAVTKFLFKVGCGIGPHTAAARGRRGFKVRGRYRPGFGRLAMAVPVRMSPVGGQAGVMCQLQNNENQCLINVR